MPASTNSPVKILLVEDEASVASFIVRSLTEEGYEVSVAPEGNTGYQMATNHDFALILLDVMLPGLSGLEICRRLRDAGNITPVIMLTALGSTENLVTGLDSGADDYLAKPFKLAELLARIRSLTRRSAAPVRAAAQTGTSGRNGLSMADLFLDTDEKIAFRGDTSVTLTATEYRLLEYMLRNPRRVLSRADLLEEVWGIDVALNTKVVDVYINYLRRKLDRDFEPKLIHTAVGMGYIMKENT